MLDAFAGNAFGSVRERIARHLLDLAAGGEEASEDEGTLAGAASTSTAIRKSRKKARRRDEGPEEWTYFVAQLDEITGITKIPPK